MIQTGNRISIISIITRIDLLLTCVSRDLMYCAYIRISIVYFRTIYRVLISLQFDFINYVRIARYRDKIADVVFEFFGH